MTVSFQSPRDAYYFFGYFDKSPFDAGDEKLLAQRVSFMDRMPGANDALEIGYFDWRQSDRFVKIAESRAWNWQTGCMAQWLGPDCDTEIIYSDRDEHGTCTMRLNIATGEKRRYPAAVGGVDPAGRYALSVDYEHMHGMREGYGFAAQGDTGAMPGDQLTIRRLDLDSGEVEAVVGLPDVKRHRPLPSMSTPNHMLDNPLFNPAGDRFAFFHRWQLPDGASYTRLYTADVDGTDLRLLHDTGRVSHINWRDDRELVAFLGWETRVNRLRKNTGVTRYLLKPLVPIYHLLVGHNSRVSRKIRGDGYALLDARQGNARKLGFEALDRDGHPSFAPGRPDWMLTDTYPDWRQRARLLLYSISADQAHEVDTVHSVKQHDDTELRCDLHPRWSRDGRFVCIDHMEDGHRGMRVYDVSPIVGGP